MKYHPHGSVLLITFRVEEGLLLLSNPLCQAIIKSCLARALAVHPGFKISHIIVEGTHLHLLGVVDSPDDVPGFIKCFKTESSHAFNIILGRRKRTIWCEGYDSPVVLTPLRAAVAIAYIYSNPTKDNLVDCIDEYPGVSSWGMFQRKDCSKLWQRLRRFHYQKLAPDSHNLRGYTKEAERLISNSKEAHPFTIYPNAWMEAFGVSDQKAQEDINARIVLRIRTLEARYKRVRERLGKKVPGRERLLSQPINPSHLPQNYSGRRMWCLSEERSLRKAFIEFLGKLMAEARQVQRRWRIGEFSVPYPPGLYPPCMPKLVEPLLAQ